MGFQSTSTTRSKGSCDHDFFVSFQFPLDRFGSSFPIFIVDGRVNFLDTIKLD